MLFYEEDDYLRALAKYSDLPVKTWLFQYFELYKSTLIWPPGLPPINRCGLIPGTFRTKFNSFYREKLDEFTHDFDNENQTIKFF
jgi:hypothetical protein